MLIYEPRFFVSEYLDHVHGSMLFSFVGEKMDYVLTSSGPSYDVCTIYLSLWTRTVGEDDDKIALMLSSVLCCGFTLFRFVTFLLVGNCIAIIYVGEGMLYFVASKNIFISCVSHE